MMDALNIHNEYTATPKGGPGRNSSPLWEYFTNEPTPWKKLEAECKHCHKMIRHHKKSDYANSHLRRCEEFQNYCSG